jgi:LacI family transcriptional regulator
MPDLPEPTASETFPLTEPAALPGDGGAPPQVRRPNLRDVAERAGVALSTASRAMAGVTNVRPAVRDRVLAAAQELGYERNLLAQSLRRGASMSVGFVVRDISNPVMSEIVLGAERVLRTAGYALSLTNSEGQPSLDAEYVRYFRQRAVDGLLLSLSDEQYEPTLEELQALAVPFVAVDRELPEELGGSAVYCDHARGLESAARYLVSLGHRRIGLLAGPRELRPGREVARALNEFCTSHPEVTGVIEHGPFSVEFGERATSRMLTSADRPTAIIAGGYYILLGIAAACRAFSVRMPDDISVVAFDDLDSLAFFDPPISVVSREPLELGRRAGELLLERFEGRTPAPVVVSPVFRPRSSCGPPPNV